MDFSLAVLTLEFPEMIIGVVLLRGLIERAALRAGKHNRDLRCAGHPPDTRLRFGRFRDRRRRVACPGATGISVFNVNPITLAHRYLRYSSKAGHIGVQDGKQVRPSDGCRRSLRSRLRRDHAGILRALRFRAFA